MEEIVNRVANSGLITLNLEDYFKGVKIQPYNIGDNLWQGIVLKEKDFRAFVKDNDWSFYKDAYVNLFCSEDAVIPSWAYLLITVALEPYAKKVIYGSSEDLDKVIVDNVIDSLDLAQFKEGRVIVKGCSSIPHAEYALVRLTTKLKPVVKSLMFGEPCSTVPIYKKSK